MTSYESPDPLRRAWDLSAVTLSGRALDRPGPQRTYLVPRRLWLDGERLYYRFTAADRVVNSEAVTAETTSTKRRRSGSSRGMSARASQLTDFISRRLDTARDVAMFAHRWGVLGICQHGLPHSHTGGFAPSCDLLTADIDDGAWEPAHWEPLAAWRFLRTQAITLLNVCARLALNDRVDRETWEQLFDDDGPLLAPNRFIDYDEDGVATITPPMDVRTGQVDRRPPVLSWFLNEDDDRAVWECEIGVQRLCAGLVVQSWLEVGRPEMHFSWGSPLARTWVGAGSLFGMLAMQLALAASRSPGFAICSGCGSLFQQSRLGKPRQRTYCPECREDKVPQRDAARVYRGRKGARPRKTRD